MATGFQEVTIIGNLGKNPHELVKTVGAAGKEKSVLTVGVAVTEKQQGAEHTEWFNCTFWGPLADALVSYTEKGSKVFVQAKRKTTVKQQEDGTNRYFEEYVVSDLNILTFRKDQDDFYEEDEAPVVHTPTPPTQPARAQAPAPRQGKPLPPSQPPARQAAPTRAATQRTQTQRKSYDPGEALGFGPEEDFR